MREEINLPVAPCKEEDAGAWSLPGRSSLPPVPRTFDPGLEPRESHFCHPSFPSLFNGVDYGAGGDLRPGPGALHPAAGGRVRGVRVNGRGGLLEARGEPWQGGHQRYIGTETAGAQDVPVSELGRHGRGDCGESPLD